MKDTKTISLYEMELCVCKFYNIRKYIIVPNIRHGLKIHECDLFILNSNNYVTEVEIKRSKADLKKDANKWHNHEDDRIKYLYFALPLEMKDCIDLVPERAGILLCHTKISKAGNILYKCEEIRKPIANNKSRKLDEVEKMKILRLSNMRIWSLKEKIVKMNLKSNL